MISIIDDLALFEREIFTILDSCDFLDQAKACPVQHLANLVLLIQFASLHPPADYDQNDFDQTDDRDDNLQINDVLTFSSDVSFSLEDEEVLTRTTVCEDSLHLVNVLVVFLLSDELDPSNELASPLFIINIVFVRLIQYLVFFLIVGELIVQKLIQL